MQRSRCHGEEYLRINSDCVRVNSRVVRGGLVLRLTLVLEAWVERRRQRHALRELSDHVLKDIGIGRSEAEQEWRKPFWRA